MARIPVVTLFRGDAHIICNVSDRARFEADGWGEKEAPEKKEAAKEAAPEAEQPKAKKR